MASTQLVFFHELHIQQVSGPPVTSKVNKHSIRFPRDEEGKMDVKTGKYDTKNQPNQATFKYEQEGRFCFGVDKTESKNGAITDKLCPVFDYSGGNIVTIDAHTNKYRNNLQEFESLPHHRHNGLKEKKQTRYGYVNL